MSCDKLWKSRSALEWVIVVLLFCPYGTHHVTHRTVYFIRFTSIHTTEPTQYRTTVVEGKAILISGHDLMDLYHLLEQTEGTGINVYTHGEMLPAHAYPKLKAFKHLAGNYGTAWQNQKVRTRTVVSFGSPSKLPSSPNQFYARRYT